MLRCPVCNSPDIEIAEFVDKPSEAYCRLCGCVSKVEFLGVDEPNLGSALSLQEQRYILSLEKRIQNLEDSVKRLTDQAERMNSLYWL